MARVDEVEAVLEELWVHLDDDVLLVGVVEAGPEEAGSRREDDPVELEVAPLARFVDDADGDVTELPLFIGKLEQIHLW